ncbi:MAG: LysR family transcriptional regulator [Acutalibacteraceae bacterium]
MTLQHLKYAVKVADVGSMNEAAKQLLISQPSLSAAIRALEEETGIDIFKRTNKGVYVTAEGSAFLEHARFIVAQYDYIEHQYVRAHEKKRFAVSTQHYAFAVKAFINTVKQLNLSEYQTAIRETRTSEIMKDVCASRSELGIIYLSKSNEAYMKKD